MPKLRPGDAAPDITLTSTAGEAIPLSDAWKSSVGVLTFYRGDTCPVCNRYLHALQERHADFEAAGARVLAISADRPELGEHTSARHELPFALLSDTTRQAIDAYDVVYNEAEGHAEPAVFVVAPDGAIAYESIVSGPLGRPSPDDLLMIVQAVAKRARDAASSQRTNEA